MHFSGIAMEMFLSGPPRRCCFLFAGPPFPLPPADTCLMNTRDVKKAWLEIWVLSWPLVLTMFLQFVVGLTDVYVAGLFRPEVQGAVGFGGQVLFFFSVFANALGVGIVAIIARSVGARDQGAMWHTARQGLLLAVLVTGPLSLLGIVLGSFDQLYWFLPEKVAAEGARLLPFYAAALLPQGVLTVVAAICRARGRMLVILLCYGLTALLNLAGDFLLPFGYWLFPGVGAKGIAMATMASSLFGALLALLVLVRQGMAVSDWRLDRQLAARLWKLGWPMGMLQLGWQFGSLALYAILGFLPAQAVAATAALTNGLRIEAILYLPAYALNMIAAVLVGQALGSRNRQRAAQLGWQVAAIAALVLSLLAVPVFIYSMELARAISPDPLVQQLTHLYLRFNMISQPFMAVGVCLGGALEGAGDTAGTMKVVLGALWVIRIPLAAVLALATRLGAVGVWGAMVVSMILQGIFMAIRFRRGRWQDIDFAGGPGKAQVNM
ncbi:MAG: MATE family efflux transporter [Desulfurivibrio sp.]|nr:MAG: MATE family efflux transporter [Desulfurivibrio sp.]